MNKWGMNTHVRCTASTGAEGTIFDFTTINESRKNNRILEKRIMTLIHHPYRIRTHSLFWHWK